MITGHTPCVQLAVQLLCMWCCWRAVYDMPAGEGFDTLAVRDALDYK
jgi:hypothetical protein